MNDLIEQARKHLTEQPDDGEQELLTELISLRTGLIAAGLAKTKQYANQIDTQVRQLKSNASLLRTSRNQEDTLVA